jgi:hypothetical protein
MIFTKNIGFLRHIRSGKRFFSFKLVVTSFTTILTISDNSNNNNNNDFFFISNVNFIKNEQRGATLN